MRLHQILTGSCNGDINHVSYGTLNEFKFLAYASGCDVVILNGYFVRIQIIPGERLGNRIVSAVSCSSQNGKIAVANATGVYIFAPCTRLLTEISKELSKVTWHLQKHLDVSSTDSIKCLAWSQESFFSELACGLLCASHDGTLALWRSLPVEGNELQDTRQSEPHFSIESGSLNSESLSDENVPSKASIYPDSTPTSHWQLVWTGQLQGSPQTVSFSPDGRYFAVSLNSNGHTASTENVKVPNSHLLVWFRIPSTVMAFDESATSTGASALSRDCHTLKEKWEPLSLPHPCRVVTFSWRARSQFIPAGWIPNVLLTSSEDRVCRLWVEQTESTLLHSSTCANEPGDLASKTSKFSGLWTHTTADYPCTITMSVNANLMSTSNPMKPEDSPQRTTFPLPPPLLYHPVLRHLLDYWLTDPFSNVQISIESVQARDPKRTECLTVPQWSPPRFIFATAIATDGLLSTSNESGPNATNAGQVNRFVIYWLNNKVHRFDQRIRSLLMDTVARILGMPISSDASNADNDAAARNTLTDHLALIDQSFAVLLGEWQHAPDVVVAIHPEDGSLVVWYIHGVDLSVPKPNGIRTQLVHLSDEFTRSSNADSVFTSTPNLGTRYSQVTSSLRSRLHEAFPLSEAQSIIPGGVILYLTTSSVPRLHWQLAGLEPHDTTLSHFTYRAFLPMLFCRLFVLHNAMQLVRPRPKVEITQTPGSNNLKGRHLLEAAILAGLTEVQLLWTVLDTKLHATHYVTVVTQHANGSLRYWRMDVSESSRFQWIESVNGSARLSGHRFHTEAMVSHPLLPLVLTTSHYVHGSSIEPMKDDSCSRVCQTTESHSELILWSIGPVGPLTTSASSPSVELHFPHCSHTDSKPKPAAALSSLKSMETNVADLFTPGGCSFRGGLFEVARIDVSHSRRAHTWFNDLAWFPCLLTTSITSYPIALFVGSVTSDDDEEEQLGCFLAFADAKNGFPQAFARQQAENSARSMDLASSDTDGFLMHLRVVLPQSTRRCPSAMPVSELRPPVPMTLLFHVFPSALIPGLKTNDSINLGDISKASGSQESSSSYFIVRLTRWTCQPDDLSRKGNWTSEQAGLCQLEMWRVRVITEAGFPLEAQSYSNPIQSASLGKLVDNAEKVCDCQLPVPSNVSIIRAEVSAAHVSWAALSTYNAPPPYLIVSACSDGRLRFWRCEHQAPDVRKEENETTDQFSWCEWQMPLAHALSSSIELEEDQPPLVLDVDCAYSGRVAVAYVPCSRGSPKRVSHSPGVNGPQILVAVYECESSGGCEWILEDTIDLSAELHHDFYHHKMPPCVQLDWVSTEDGGHLLSVLVGSRIVIYAPMCKSISIAPGQQQQQQQQPPSTLMTTLGEVYLAWNRVAATRIHMIGVDSGEFSPDHTTVEKVATGHDLWLSLMHHVPKHRNAVWLRDGLLLVCAHAEVHVYSQWPNESSVTGLALPQGSTAALNNERDGTLQREEGDNLAIDQTADSAVTGSASMNVARLTKTYSAYLLQPSSSSTLLNTMGILPSTVTEQSSSLAQKHAGLKSIEQSMSQSGPASSSSYFESPDLSLLANLGLFESVQVFSPVLPQFHPRQLLEWMNLGHLRRVQAILAHLTRCLVAWDQNPTLRSAQQKRASSSWGLSYLKETFRSDTVESRTATGKPPSYLSVGTINAPSADQSNILEAQAIPPLPLYVLLAIDALRASDLVQNKPEAHTVFDPMDDLIDKNSADESNLFKIQDDDMESDQSDDALLESDEPRQSFGKRSKPNGMKARSVVENCGMSMWSLNPTSLFAMSQFRPQDARLLTEFLTTRQLPGLSPLDQMYLLGIADLMSNTQADTTERLSGLRPTTMDVSVRRMSLTAEGAERKPVHTNQGLDECGLRFLLTVQLYSYLSRTLPPARRAQLLSSGLTNSSLVWAYHSDAEEELLACLPSNQFGDGTELTWNEFKRYGCGWWIRSDALLRRCAEKIARTAFQTTKDPMESVVFYLAMHKAKVVAGLFKTIGNKTLENFFRSDFEPGRPACRQAKLNAFRLLSQHRYTQAAGLFLVAGCLEDAVRVCLDTLKDLQLAVVLVRLYTSTVPGMDNHAPDSPYPQLLRQHVITHKDPFLRSMAYWTLGDPLAALQTLLEGPVLSTTDQYIPTGQPVPGSTNSKQTTVQNPQHPQLLERSATLAGHSALATCLTYHSVYPSVFKFYTFLRSHPLVLRQWRLNAPTSADTLALRRLASLERRLYFRTAHHYSALGCPTLALEVLTKLPPLVAPDRLDRRGSVLNGFQLDPRRTSQTTLMSPTNQTPLKKPASDSKDPEASFTWSSQDLFDTPREKLSDQFKIEWSDDDESDVRRAEHNSKSTMVEHEGFESHAGRYTSSPNYSNQGDPSESDPVTTGDEFVIDLIANQLKFIACLKIVAEELSTLAAGAESEGVSLRQHVWHWLEHELAVVNLLTTPGAYEEITDVTTMYQLLLNSDNSQPSASVIKDTSTTEFNHSLDQGPLTTPSYMISLNHSVTTNLADCARSQPRNIVSTAASIFLSPSAVSAEIREAELKRMQTRLTWLRSHQAFLTSLINFCGLYGASGVGLQAVRIELLLLLTELHTYPIHPQLQFSQTPSATAAMGMDSSRNDSYLSSAEHSVPSTTFPGVLWPSSTLGLVDGIPFLRTTLHLPPGALLLPDPVKHIQCMIHDLVSSLESLPPPYLNAAIIPCPYHASGTATNPNGSSTIAGVTSHSPLTQTGLLKDADRIFCPQCAWVSTQHRQRRVFLLRNLCSALSICLHQCLSIGGWLGPGTTTHNGSVGRIALPASPGMTVRSIDRLNSVGQPLKSNTEPSKWPGITHLRKYIQSQNTLPQTQPMLLSVASTGSVVSSSTATLNVPSGVLPLHPVNRHWLVGLLAQALSSTYLGLLVYALHTRDACALYRLASVRLDSATWSKVFGGTYRSKPTRPSAPPSAPPAPHGTPRSTTPRPPRPERPTPVGKTSSEIRVPDVSGTTVPSQGISMDLECQPRSSSRLSGAHTPTDQSSIGASNQKRGTPPPAPPISPPDEWFVPPQCSMLSCLLERPPKQEALPDDPSRVFDSEDSEPPSDDYDSYSEAIGKQQRRLRRLARRLERSQIEKSKREAQQRAKEALKRRLARHTGILDLSDAEDEQNGSSIPTVEELYPELVEEERKRAELKERKSLALEAQSPRFWIFRRLHLDPDFSDLQFYANGFDLMDLPIASASEDVDDDELSETDDPDVKDDLSMDVLQDHGTSSSKQWEVQRQWAKGDSFSWRLMRLGLMQLAKRELERLVRLLDFGSDDLAVYAPALVTATRLVDMWMLSYRLELTAPPALTICDLTRANWTLVPTCHLLPPVNFLPNLIDLDVTTVSTSSVAEVQSDAMNTMQSTNQLPSAGATRAMMRLRQLIDPSKTPFQTRDPFSLPTKRLWCYLVRQPSLDDLFMRHVFRKPRLIQSEIIPSPSGLVISVSAVSEEDEAKLMSESQGLTMLASGSMSSVSNLANVNVTSSDTTKLGTGKTTRSQASDKQSASISTKPNSLLFDDAIRLIHKEQDPLIAMCVNQANHGCIAIATPKEVIELNVDNLVTLPAWYADEVEYDLELMRRPQARVYPGGGTDDFIVINSNLEAVPGTHGSQGVSSTSQSLAGGTTGSGSSGANVVLKRTIQAVYSLASHPTLPYYLCGTGTGSIHLFEWATPIPVVAGFTNTYSLTASGASGQFPAGSRGARVTALHFDQSGRRFGCGDADGNFGLWNMQVAASEKPPYFRCHCHAKSLADFCFVGSSTLVATVGNGRGAPGDTSSSGHLIAGVNAIGASAATAAHGYAGAHRFGADSGSSTGLGAISSFGQEQNATNLALWDTLLPPHRCGVVRFTDPELECPCTAVAHCTPSLHSSGWPNWSSTESSCLPWMPRAPGTVSLRDRVVAVGTKRGDVCFVDLRKPGVFHSFNAHESSAVRTLCVDTSSDCLITGGADGIVKIWRLSEPELIASFSGNIHHQGRGAAAAVAAAALFRGNQSAAIIAATHPGVSQIRLLPVVTGASLLRHGKQGSHTSSEDTADGLTYEQYEHEKHSLLAACTACRFLTCGADGGLRMRSFVVRPKPFTVA